MIQPLLILKEFISLILNVYENVYETARHAQKLRHHAQNHKHKGVGMFDKIKRVVNTMRLADQIKKLRIEKELTQEMLATEMHTTR
ncbi:hypothetical protein ACJVVU_08110 [Staphylococcus coagulans]|uniref:hypothetical protein n=1 Tax=Staphylococcus coagulans TaxID=74706 RepID=UPI00398074C6